MIATSLCFSCFHFLWSPLIIVALLHMVFLVFENTQESYVSFVLRKRLKRLNMQESYVSFVLRKRLMKIFKTRAYQAHAHGFAYKLTLYKKFNNRRGKRTMLGNYPPVEIDCLQASQFQQGASPLPESTLVPLR